MESVPNGLFLLDLVTAKSAEMGVSRASMFPPATAHFWRHWRRGTSTPVGEDLRAIADKLGLTAAQHLDLSRAFGRHVDVAPRAFVVLPEAWLTVGVGEELPEGAAGARRAEDMGPLPCFRYDGEGETLAEWMVSK